MAYTVPRTWVTAETVTAAQLNEQIRDNLLAAFPTDAVWQDWTPSYTNLTVGNGTVKARYIQIGKFVRGYWAFTLGSTSAVGSATTVTAPVTLSSDVPNGAFLGLVRLQGTGNYVGMCVKASETRLSHVMLRVSGSYIDLVNVTATTPFTWTTGHVMVWEFAYEAA